MKKRRIIAETEVGLAVLYCSREFFCNPEKSTTELLRPGKSAQLRITNSKQHLQNTASTSMTSQVVQRRSPRKATQAKVVTSIDLLESDDDMDGGNKENKTAHEERQASLSFGETPADEISEKLIPETPLENFKSCKATQAKIVATIDLLESDDDIDGRVQENETVPEDGHTSVSLAETPADESIEESIPETPLDNSNSNRDIPAAHESFLSAKEASQKTHETQERFESAITTNETSQKSPEAQENVATNSTTEPSRKAPSTTPEPISNKRATRSSLSKSDLFNFSNSSSSEKSTKNQRKRQISESREVPEGSKKARKQDPKEAESSSNRSDLFNFSITSSSGNSAINPRKRQASGSPELTEESEKAKKRPVQQPSKSTRRSTRKQVIQDSSDEETAPIPQPSNSRKRKAALDNPAGLFAFNNNFVKKIRPAKDTQEYPNEIAGIIPLQKTSIPSHIKDVYLAETETSIEPGVWLIKKLSSVKLSDSVDGIKSEQNVTNEEISVIDPSIDTQDIKLPMLKTLFIIEESSMFNSPSSVFSKRKSFVKMQNFKPQTSSVTMKLFNISETREALDKF